MLFNIRGRYHRARKALMLNLCWSKCSDSKLMGLVAFIINHPPVVDSPVVDSPVVDRPVADRPVADSPVVDSPVIDCERH